MVFVGLITDEGFHTQVQEPGFLHRAHVDSGPSVLQHHLAGSGGGQHVLSYFVADFHILRDAVFAEGHFHLGLLARLIEPVGMIRHRQPQVVRTVGIILGSYL